mmetsp:Transcript_28029/g.52590  ORF Transcript_28029/g.52590 Transcript_28029/m.52590 type:complete len:204 (-) Transcript_28029:780-1391(-)
MKLLSCLLVGLNWQQPLKIFGSTTTTTSSSLERNDKILDLLRTARSVGQVGVLAPEQEQLKVEEAANIVIPFTDSKPARTPLIGEHKLVYSAAKGASSGKIGPLVGKVSQLFEDDEIFYNRVSFGPLQIALRAKREIKNDSTIKVSFLETSFSLFGKTLKKQQAGGGGIWKVKFTGKIEDKNGKEKLVRIMETPSLFVLEQDL